MSNNREIEIRFSDIDTNKFRKKLEKIGAKIINKKRIMPLMVFHHPYKKSDYYIRIRDEGNQITLTVKTKLKDKYQIEREVDISSFKEGIAILKKLGCKKKYYVEKMRETWKIPGCKEIVIDSYPGLPEYIEVECYTEKELNLAIKKLDLNLNSRNKNLSINSMYYNLYGIPKNRKFLFDLTFKNANHLLGKLIKKNRDQFNNILNEQKKYNKN